MDSTGELLNTLEGRNRTNYKLMAPKLKRTCLSAQSALSGHPNVEDVPLGAKLPMIPGSRMLLYTASLGEKLHQPSCDFDRTYPSDVYISNEYRCLHDSHLRHYFCNRKNMTRRLRKRGFVTSENKVVCSLKEYNLYRQYLKHLSIEYFNKIYREKYEEECEVKHDSIKTAIKDRQKDPNNPITLRINCAKSVRRRMEKSHMMKGRRVLRLAREERENRLRKQQDELKKRIKEEIFREQEREKLKKVKLIRQREKEMLKEELLFYKHQEDVYRRKEIEERKKSMMREKERKLTQKYERKKHFHLMKMAELRQMLEDEETNRKNNVKLWQNYFAEKLMHQQRKLKSIMEKERKARELTNRKIEESLRSRGWTGVSLHQSQLSKESDSKRQTKPRSAPAPTLTTNQLSALGFHNAVVPQEILDLIWDGEGSSDDGEEDSAGDALVPPKMSISHHARDICNDVIIYGRSNHLVDDVIQKAHNTETISRDIVKDSIRISHEVLLPMIHTYEQRAGTEVDDIKVTSVLQDIWHGVFDEERDHISPLIDITSSGKASINCGKQASTVRFVVSNTDLPMDNMFGGKRRHRPPTPKRKVAFDQDSNDLKMPESQLVLDQTIKTLANTVVNEVFKTATATHDLKEEIGGRVANLASCVVNAIISFDADGRSCSPSVSACSQSTTDSTTSEASIERKISWLAKEMIKDIVDDKKKADVKSTSIGSDDRLMETSTASDVSILALHVVRSALMNVHSDVDLKSKECQKMFDRLEPVINDLSSKLVDQIIKEREKFIAVHQMESSDRQEFARLETKISQLALSIVGSILQNDSCSRSSSATSLSSTSMEARINEFTLRIVGAIMSLKRLLPNSNNTASWRPLKGEHKELTVDDFMEEIFNLNTLSDAPKKLFHNLCEEDIQRISSNMARKLAPPRTQSSAVSSGVDALASALADDTISRIVNETISPQTSSLSLGTAMKLLSDSVVVETLNEAEVKVGSSKKSKVIEENKQTEIACEEFVVSSRAGELAEAAIDSTINKISSDESSGSDVGRGISMLAITTIQESIQKAAKDVSSQSDNSSAVSLLADELARLTLGKEKKKTSSGGLDSALSSIVSRIVVNTISAKVLEHIQESIQESSSSKINEIDDGKLKQEIAYIVQSLIDSRTSSPSSDTSKLCDRILEKRNMDSLLSSNDLSSISSAASQLAHNIMKHLIGQFRSDESDSSGEYSNEATNTGTFSSAVSLLAGQIAKLSIIKHANKMSMNELEHLLSCTVNQVVVETISSKVLEQIQERSSLDFREIDTDELKNEIIHIVQSLMEINESKSSNTSNESARRINDQQKYYMLYVALLPSTDRSTISSAASFLANNITQQLLAKYIMNESYSNNDSPEINVKIKDNMNEDGVAKVSDFDRKVDKSRKYPSQIFAATPDRFPWRRSESVGGKLNKTEVATLHHPQPPNTKRTSKCKSYSGSRCGYESSFVSWRDSGSSNIIKSGKLFDAEITKVQGSNSKFISKHKMKAEKEKSKLETIMSEEFELDEKPSEMQSILGELASRIVHSVIDEQAQLFNSDEVASKLTDSKSLQNFVESLALGIVTSLLGLDVLRSNSPLTSRPSSQSESQTCTSDDVDVNIAPKPSTGCQDTSVDLPHSTPTRPSAPVPGKRQRTKLQEEEQKKYEYLTTILCSPITDNSLNVERNKYQDNAQNHPHRVPSPSTMARSCRINRTRTISSNRILEQGMRRSRSLEQKFTSSSMPYERKFQPISTSAAASNKYGKYRRKNNNLY